jgi:Fe-Mn family superoxide dismutase
MWEHSYLLDYVPGDKKKYIDAFFENLNWEVVEKRFVDVNISYICKEMRRTHRN